MGLGGGTRFHRGDPARSNVGSACASRGCPQYTQEPFSPSSKVRQGSSAGQPTAPVMSRGDSAFARAGPAFVVVFLDPRRDHRHEHDPDDERHGQGPGDAAAQPRRGRGFMRRLVHALHVADAVLGKVHGEAVCNLV